MSMLPIKKYVEEDQVTDYTEPCVLDNIPPKDVEVVFECEDCHKKSKDDLSNVVYNGAPICCNQEMMLSHAKVTY